MKISNRKHFSTAALHIKLYDVWVKKDKIKRKLKILIYKVVAKTVLLYNCGTWAMRKNDEQNINAFHRKQLRKVLNVKYQQDEK